MATTRIIPMHLNKGKTIARCLSDRTDYAMNPDKTNGGELISSYACDPATANAEFLYSKRQYSFSSERWEYHELTGSDHGVDCTIELVENEQWGNKKIEGQIKGTRNSEPLKNKDAFSFSLDKKTINYGLGSSNAFVLFYVTVDDEKVFYLPLQDYFIANPELFERLENSNQKMSLHIPRDNIVQEEDFDLQQIAKSVYVDGPSRRLHKAN
jgi:hypothetical protein